VKCAIKKKGMKSDCDNVMKEDNTTLGFVNFKTGDGILNHLASMADDQAVGEWKLHHLEDMKWNHIHQCLME
jgi:hypothetical protein